MNQTRSIFLLISILLSTVIRSQHVTQPEYKDLDSALEKKFGSGFGFSVVVADESGILFSNAYGNIDSRNKMQASEKTLFNIASVSKSFTAIGIMLMAEEGRLNLSDTITKFFDNVPDDKLTITVSDLLSHRSGFLQNYVCDGIENSTEALNALLADTLGSVPGASVNYSNQNYEMLALIIEAITHSKYEDYIRAEILYPLEMKNTCFWDEASNYINVAGKNRSLPDSILKRNWGFIGSVGMYSTPADLLKFINAVIKEQLVSANSLKLMFTEYYKTESGVGIGYGWFINDTTDWNTNEIWTRGTEDWGHNAVIRWFPNKKKIIIVCSNSGEIGGDKQKTGNRIVSDYIADYLWKK